MAQFRAFGCIALGEEGEGAQWPDDVFFCNFCGYFLNLRFFLISPIVHLFAFFLGQKINNRSDLLKKAKL